MSTGKLKLVTLKLNHEEFDKFTITIKVMDNAILSKSFLKNITLEIGNVNQPPTDILLTNKKVN